MTSTPPAVNRISDNPIPEIPLGWSTLSPLSQMLQAYNACPADSFRRYHLWLCPEQPMNCQPSGVAVRCYHPIQTPAS